MLVVSNRSTLYAPWNSDNTPDGINPLLETVATAILLRILSTTPVAVISIFSIIPLYF
nr:MAG TPA: hypothetical protein [Caudoviricetes sp.]